MCINKRNTDGYIDKTPYQALMNIEARERDDLRYMPVVYICTPDDGDDEMPVSRYCRFAVRQGCIPIAGQMYLRLFMDDADTDQRKKMRRMCVILMSKCKEVWVFGAERTDDMKQLISQARTRNKDIRYFDAGCQELT